MGLEHSETFQVVKIDLDIVPPDDWLNEWIETRKNILFFAGYDVTKIRMHPSKHGLHFWFHLDAAVGYDILMKLQFLCGDDPKRVWFGLQRRGFVRFRGLFNILFNKKWSLKEE